MVDDRIVTQRVPAGRGEPLPESKGEKAFEAGLAAYSDAGLAPHPDKGFRDSTHFRMLGADVDGVAGKVRVRADSVAFGVWMAVAVCRTRWAPTQAVEIAASLFSNQLLYRRCGFAVPNAGADPHGGLYGEVARARQGGRRRIRLSGAARDELLLLAALAPLWNLDLRAEVVPKLYASDACGGARAGIGGATLDIPRAAADDLWRRRLRKGGGTGMLPADPQAWRSRYSGIGLGHAADLVEDNHLDEEGGDPTATDELRARVGDLCDAGSWRATFAYPGERSEHINIGEMRGVRTSVRRAIREGHFNKRLLCVVDSMVVCHSLAKGRSASYRLHKVIRTFAYELLFSGLSLGLLPVPSAQNPADDPSRGRPVRRGWAAGARVWAGKFWRRPESWPAGKDVRSRWLWEWGAKLQGVGVQGWRSC